MTSDAVPVWPHIEAITRPDGTGELTINGTSHPIQARTVEEARQTILTRIADTAAKLRRPVRALASGPDGHWPLIVHPDGRVEADDSRPANPAPLAPSLLTPKTGSTGKAAAPAPPVTGASASAAKPHSGPWARASHQVQAAVRSTDPRKVSAPPPAAPRRRRVMRLTVAAAGAVVLVAAGTFAVVALTGDDPAPAPSAPVVPGEGANLPVQAPVGYGRSATWSVPLSNDPQVLIAPDGGVLAAPATDGKITIFDPTTGAATWHGNDPVEDLHVTQIAEEPVLAADSPGTLHVWPLAAANTTGVAPTTIDLGSDQAEVTYDGTAPLIELPDQTVALLVGNSETPIRRDVPDGATPVAATPQHVIAVGPGAWWTISPDADPVRKNLPKPKQAVGDPTAAIAVGGNQLAVVWHTKDSKKDVLALVGLNRNTIRASGLIRSSAFPPDAEPLRDRAGSARTIGPVLVDVGPKPVIADLGEMTPEAVIGRTVYGTSEDKPAIATWGPDGVKLKVAESAGESARVAALTKNIAFVVVTQGDETVLYALPRIGGKNL